MKFHRVQIGFVMDKLKFCLSSFSMVIMSYAFLSHEITKEPMSTFRNCPKTD